MTSKRDVNLVRLACRWRWLTAEQGEDCLALHRRLGPARTIEEIILRRGYLGDAELAELAEAAAEARSEKATRPAAPPREQTVVRAVTLIRPPPARRRPRPAGANPSAAPAPRAPPTRGVVARRPAPASASRPPSLADAPSPDVTRYEPLPAALRRSGTDPDAPAFPLGASEPWTQPEPSGSGPAPPPEVTRYEPLPWFAQEPPAPTARDEADGAASEPARPEAEARPSPVPDSSQDRTVMGPIPEALLARLRDRETSAVIAAPPAGDLGEAAPEGFDGPPTGSMPVPVEAPPRPPTGTVPLEARPSTERPSAARPAPAVGAEVQVSVQTPLSGADDEAPPRLPPELFAPVPLLEPLDEDEGDSFEEPTADGYEQVSLLGVDGAAEALLGRFGPYTLQRIVARGRHSVVYLGSDEGGRSVAVKVLGGDPDANAKVLGARGDALLAAAQLAAPEVVRILDLGRVDARHYVALEYVEGWNLAERLAFDEPPSPVTAFGWASQVAAALAAAQAQGLCHGDVRPARVLLSEAQGARLGGFGFAADPTPDRFSPPEGPSATPAADAFGLGAVLFAALTGGAAPHEGRQHLPPLPAEARDLGLALLDEDPEARPTDFAGLAARLSAIAEPLAEASDVAPVAARPPLAQVALRTGVASAGLFAGAIALGLLGQTLAADNRGLTQLGLQAALGAAALSGLATLLLGTLDLIRRGQLPLPTSAQWLVQLSEGAALLGAAAAVLGGALGPPAYMNLLLATLGGMLLLSAAFGIVLRRAVARGRPDRGVGRILAVLSDPWLQRWRTVHGPALTVLFGLAVSRFAILAYFSSA